MHLNVPKKFHMTFHINYHVKINARQCAKDLEHDFSHIMQKSWFHFGKSIKVQISFLVFLNLDWNEQLTIGFKSFNFRKKYFLVLVPHRHR
jgi:hypothetical protein